MQDFLKKLEETIKSHLKETYLPPHRARTPGWTHHDLVFFAKGADRVSTAFTEDRADLPKNYFNQKEFRSAYLLYFTLINAAKVWKCLEEGMGKDYGLWTMDYSAQGAREGKAPSPRSGVEGATRAPLNRPLRILDLGCGPGTASLACSAFFRDIPLEIMAVDQNIHATRDATHLWRRMKTPIHHKFIATALDLHPKNIEHFLKRKRFDLIIAANFLSEMSPEKQISLSTQILKSANTFIIIEPALRKTTRELQALRDELLARKVARVLAPCLHQQNCPMLATNRRDWCHFYIAWKCPILIRQVDELIGNRHDYLKMAYMIFRGRTTDNGPRTTDLWRTVSSPLISKGKKEFILCGANGKLEKIFRLDRNRRPNHPFDEIKRGDVLEGKIHYESIKIQKPF